MERIHLPSHRLQKPRDASAEDFTRTVFLSWAFPTQHRLFGINVPPCYLFCTLLSEKDADVLPNLIHFGETPTPHCLQLSNLSLEALPVLPRGFKNSSLQPGSTSPRSTFLQPHTESWSLRITKVVTRNKMKEIQFPFNETTNSLKENN